MKELTIEEKAKAYDKAIKVIKDNLDALNEITETSAEVVNIQSIKNCFYRAFPELKESEDERIRKKLMLFVENWKKYNPNSALDDYPIFTSDECEIDRILAWLEKQGDQKLPIEKLPSERKTIGESLGFTTQEECDEYNQIVSDCIMSDTDKSEQKPADKEETKFKVGDEIKTANGESLTITKIDEKGYWSEDLFICGFGDAAKWELVGKSISKIDPKFHKGDWVVVSTIKGDRVVQIASVEYLKDGYPSYITTEGRWFGNGTKARLLTDKDVEIATIPESKIVVSKSKYWSEEDEEHINYLIEVFDGQQYHQAHSDEELVNWLKSLKQRYFWKPNGKNEKLTDVNHEYFSELLESDDSKDINDYAYQVAYCMSHDWAIENPTWDNVQSACRLGAKWQKKHGVSEDWSEEDKKMLQNILECLRHGWKKLPTDILKYESWFKSLKESVKSQNMWKVVDKGIYVKEPALAQKKDKSEPGHGFVVCYDHTLTPDVYERYIMLSDINCHSWWKPSDEQITVLELASKYERVFTPKQIDILIGLKEQLKKLKGDYL